MDAAPQGGGAIAMMNPELIERMRADWNRRAREDAYFYAAFARQHQSDEEFFASAVETVATLEGELARLAPSPISQRRALEIGCGPGRLMLPMSRHFGEIHGVDISERMVALARERLKGIPQARVHVTPNSDLAMFPEAFFDFVYSYTVFQHIPSRDVVLNYLRESRRVLKPGGILCCQLRGTPPMPTELEREAETWTGCHFSREDMIAFAREHDFQLVSLSGIDTQYMWTSWRKPDASQPVGFSRAELKAVTVSSGNGNRVPQRGSDAFVSLWIDGLPSSCHLATLDIAFGELRERGCYLSPVTESGACQLNAPLPRGIPLGQVPVSLFAGDRAIPEPRIIEVVPAVIVPKIVAVTDAINIGSKFRIETGGLKVTIEGIETPSEVSFELNGQQAQIVQVECKDPVLLKYEYSFYLPNKKFKGQLPVLIRASGRELPPVAVEIV